MAVLLSPVGGVAAQFFDNDGNVLSGGKIYTYAAGTTTPASTYTTGAGLIAHANPIILDSAGRVPTGEIWLTDGYAYKFVIKDANDTLIGTYDNIVGINSNFVNYTSSQEIQTATAGQTVFTLTTMAYQPGTNSLSVFVDGVNQYGPGASYAFTETSSTSVTFASGLHVGASVKFTTAVINNVGGVDSSQVTYDPPFTGSVVTNVEAKLSEYVSVTDFGAIGNGVADDTSAFQAMLNYLSSNKKAGFIPQGIYKITNTLTYTNQQYPLVLYGETVSGEFATSPRISFNGTFTDGLLIDGQQGSQGCDLRNLQFRCDSGTVTNGVNVKNLRFPRIDFCRFNGFAYGLQFSEEAGVADGIVISALVKNSYFSLNTTAGIRFGPQTVTGQWNNQTIDTCSFYGGISGIRFEGNLTVGSRILNSVFEAIVGDDIYIKQAFNMLIQGNYFEYNSPKAFKINFASGVSGLYNDAITFRNNNFQGEVTSAVIGIAGARGVVADSNHVSGVGARPWMYLTQSYSNLQIQRPTNYAPTPELMTYTVATSDGLIQNSDKVFNYQYASKGEAVAWVLFDGTAGSPTPTAAYRVSSITKNGTGDYTINFSPALGNADIVMNGTTTTSGGLTFVVQAGGSSPTTTTFRVACVNSSGTATDSNRISLTFYGVN